jgi:hypothetical protein
MREVFCYHSLHNAVHGKNEIRRLDDNRIVVYIPETGLYAANDYGLRIDVRDPRVLVCFDGDIPSGGLPKGSTVISSTPFLHGPSCHVAKVYKQRSEYEDKPSYEISRDTAYQDLHRRFVLLKTGRAIFRKYKDDSLQPKYLIVDVHNGFAEFSTSSY